jgi:hypothetical protein
VECFATLVVTRLGVGVAIDYLHLPLGVLECHLFILLLLRIHLSFALPLAGWHAFLALLLLLFVELFHKLPDLPGLTHVVARGVVHQASCTSVIATRCLMGALVTSWASGPTSCCSSSCGGGSTGERLAIATGLLLLLPLLPVVVVVVTLSSGPALGLLAFPASGAC